MSRRTSKPAPSKFLRMSVLAWFVLTFGAILLLRYSSVPLGQGSFQYRFSEREGERTVRALVMLPGGALFLAALILAASRRIAPVGITIFGVVLLSVAVWWAAPYPMSQHSFNLRSPSHEGAFALEAERIDDLGSYLKEFDQRIQRPIEQMGGTRIISNPPGMTIVFHAINRFVPPPPWLLDMLANKYQVRSDDVPFAARTIEYAVALTLIWALSAGAIYLAARELLPVPGALVAMSIAWFNPSTVHFVPGKDPAQLLTIGLMMWMLISAWKRDSIARAVAGGAVLAFGAAVGLVHFWVAAAIVIACAWQDFRRATRMIVALVCGFFAVVLIVYLFSDWNMLSTFLTVSRRYSQIQRELKLDHAIWFVIGLPIFLLFVSPSLAAFAGLWLRRRKWNFGACLAVSTSAIMLTCYVVGVSYELPRLWVAFLPPLTIGLLAATPLAHLKHEGRALRAILFIAAAHVIFTALHWSQFDARESEYRLGPAKRYFSDTRLAATRRGALIVAEPNKRSPSGRG